MANLLPTTIICGLIYFKMKYMFGVQQKMWSKAIKHIGLKWNDHRNVFNIKAHAFLWHAANHFKLLLQFLKNHFCV